MSKPLLMALYLLCFTAQAETKINFTGDAFVRGYFLNGTGPDHTQAFNHFFRLNVDAKPDENLTIKTGLILASETWEGDTHKNLTAAGTAIGGVHEDGLGNGNITHLDHAVIEYNKDGWITSVGRHQVSSPGNFLTSDDRRDRVQILKIMNNFDLLALVYDKRAEGALSNNKDDLDMYSVNYYGTTPLFKYALQTGYWISKKYSFTTTYPNSAVNLDNVKQFTPQLSGQLLGIDYNLYYTILWGGTAVYKDDHHSAAIRITKDLEIVKIDYESSFTKHGGLIAGGFDTLSSIINNSPDHSQSSIKLRTIGYGLGLVKKSETVHMVKFSKNITADLEVSIGGGYAKLLSSTAGLVLEENKVLDATAKYKFSKNLNLALAYGKFFGDNTDHAGSLTLNALF
ncbi:MAG: hypothetical protein Q7U04_15720 [Bacteriovorax sp.]|nr:hypothetical protein [Bacteriovorax sp.]